jgi:iron complex transport system ATP-binding protein
MSVVAQAVVVRLGSFTLGPLSLELPRGSVTALLGPNGGGKTTLLRALAGLQSHDGSVRMDGDDLRALDASQRARRVAFVAQRPSVPPGLSVRETVALGRLRLSSDARVVQQALQRTGVCGLGDRMLHTLSAGQLHRAAVARALAQVNPSLCMLALDEPTASLDPAWSAALGALLREQAAAGLAVVVATHDLAFAAACCDRAALLVQGSLQACGAHADVATVNALAQAFGTPFTEVVGLANRPVAMPRWHPLG